MPNWKFPCLSCAKPVKINQKGIECNACKIWVHLKCTDLSETQYNYLETNEDIPFYCLTCKPRPLYADLIFEDTTFNILTDNSSNHTSASTCSFDLDFSSAHSSDFEYIDESDPESRGLNFDSLAVKFDAPGKKKVNKPNHSQRISLRTLNYVPMFDLSWAL